MTPSNSNRKEFPIDNNVAYRQVHWLSLSKLADFMGEFTKDDLEHPIWDFFFWLDKKSTKIKTDSYILNPKYEDTSHKEGKDGITFGIEEGKHGKEWFFWRKEDIDNIKKNYSTPPKREKSAIDVMMEHSEKVAKDIFDTPPSQAGQDQHE